MTCAAAICRDIMNGTYFLVWLGRKGCSFMPGIMMPAMRTFHSALTLALGGFFTVPFSTLGRRFSSLHVQQSDVGEQIV